MPYTSTRMQRRQAGFTYLILIIAIVILSVGLAATGEVWSAAVRHQRLVQLEWVGEQYRQALGNYYESSPGRVKTYPKRLEDLLEDKRYPAVRRYLRNIYPDPLTERVDWEPVLDVRGGIKGVRTPVFEGMAQRVYVHRPITP